MFIDKPIHFPNQDLFSKLSEQGYVVVSKRDSFLLNVIWNFFRAKEMPYAKDGFYSTMMHFDFDHNKEVNLFLCEYLSEFASDYLENYRPLFANFLVKSPRSNHVVGLHQDWTYTDEINFHSVNVWLPLQATNAKNGGLYVIPGSHKLPFSIRYTPFEEKLYNVDINLLKQKSVLIETQLGDAIIYDSRLLHFSEGNLSDEFRVACAGIFLPKDAPALYYYLNGKTMNEYQTDMDFYCGLNPSQEPNQVPSRSFFFNDRASPDAIVEFLKHI